MGPPPSQEGKTGGKRSFPPNSKGKSDEPFYIKGGEKNLS